QDGEVVLVGEAIGSIGGASATAVPAPTTTETAAVAVAPVAAQPSAPVVASTESVATASGSVNASPAARKLAREQGVDLTQVQGKDAIGRIYPGDVRSHQVQPTAAPAPIAAPVVKSASASVSTDGKNVERKRMSRRRATIAKR